jgi:ribosome-binding factor A
MSIRTERVASLIKTEIGTILTREYNDPSFGFITVTDVKMTPDLRIAKVAFSIFGNEEQKAGTMRMLEDEKSHIRGLVGSHLRLKFTPALQFYRDDTLDTVDRINQLIRKIHDDDPRDNEAGS